MAAHNLLGASESPYLLQHAENPVWWYPWGEAAFERALAEDKPIFLSIGYSTCYWCHVMAHDSFEQESVAAVLNKHFVAIKIDREERPDIDQVYMDAVIGFSGHGGWPMSVFLTPDLKPFWAGTFYYRAQFVDIVEKLGVAWKEERAKIIEAARSVTEALRVGRAGRGAQTLLGQVSDELAVKQASQVFDDKNGGFGPAPKFPAPSLLGLLIPRARGGDAASGEMVKKTLEAMARGGIHDQLAGGFARYATDAAWVVPHFEKMLYDNALLAPLYFEAGKIFKYDPFTWVGARVLQFMEQELQSPEGGFYAAIDAGEVDREGEFYVWKYEELVAELTGAELELVRKLYGVSEGGNFEHANILVVPPAVAWPEVANADLLRTKLMALRNQRVRPNTDTKRLASWNGLALTAFARAYRISGNGHYLTVALRTAGFIQENLVGLTSLLHLPKGAGNGVRAFLDDYAFVAEGFLELASATLDSSWVTEAEKIFREAVVNLWSKDEENFNFSDYEDVLFQKREFVDNATPSPYAVIADVAVQLALWTGNQDYRRTAEKVLEQMSASFTSYPFGTARGLVALRRYYEPPAAVVVASQEKAAALKYFRDQSIDPGEILAWTGGAAEHFLLLQNKPCGALGARRVYRCDAQGCRLHHENDG